MQAMDSYLQNRRPTQLDKEQPLDYPAYPAPRVDGGFHVEADQLGLFRLDQHLPHVDRRKLLQRW